MFHAELVEGDLPKVVLRDSEADSVVEAAPARGGLVTRFAVAGEELLYLDLATLIDRSKNVRGGIPVLFPIAGKLTEGCYTVDGVPYALPQHGFARNGEWTLVGVRADEAAAATFQLTDDPARREVFPYEFEFRLDVALTGGRLILSAVHRNTGERTLPLHFGYHPYFAIPQAAKARAVIQTDATRIFDNRTARYGVLRDAAPEDPQADAADELVLVGVDLTVDELDLHLLDHQAHGTSLSFPQRPGTLRLSWSEHFRHFVIWTLRDRDFVCLEPWTAAGDALNTGKDLIPIAPGESVATQFEIEWLPDAK